MERFLSNSNRRPIIVFRQVNRIKLVPRLALLVILSVIVAGTLITILLYDRVILQLTKQCKQAINAQIRTIRCFKQDAHLSALYADGCDVDRLNIISQETPDVVWLFSICSEHLRGLFHKALNFYRCHALSIAQVT